ncbi:MAG: HAD family hydrolase [Candidatus Eremiobacteraeota bacterium]|nr:HAD family hydrolase [Candidatus Eremiobacteraeota bacterium]
MRTLRAVIFDLDDTLHDDTRAYRAATREVAEEIAAERGVDAATILGTYVERTQEYWRQLSVEHLTVPIADSRLDLWAAALAAAGVEDAATAREAARRYGEYRKKHYSPFPGALELLATLRERGKKLGLITNGFAETHYEKLELLGLERAFDAVLCADEVGMVKPDPRIFLRACELLGAQPSEAAMVGDRFHRDIVGARDAGLFTVYIKMHDETIPPGTAADVTVVSIEKVLDALPP